MTTNNAADKALADALSSDDPRRTLMDLALKLLREGTDRQVIVGLFEAELERASEDAARWRDEGHVGDVLDMMVGYFVAKNGNSEVRDFIDQFRASDESGPAA